MDKDLSAHEVALRRLPLPYSLALRLRDAGVAPGVAPDVVCEYLGVDEAALGSLYRVAEEKLASAGEPAAALGGES